MAYAANTPEDHVKLSKFHKVLTQLFLKLGYIIARNPRYFILFPIFVSLFCSTGLQNVKYEKDPESLYLPMNAQSREEQMIVTNLFPMNYSHNFSPSRILKLTTFVRVLVSAKDNQTMFRTTIWNSLKELDKAIRNLTIDWDESVYNFNDVCSKWNNECIKNPILELDDIMGEIENGTMWVNYPLMMFPLLSPFQYGGMDVNETEGIVVSVKAVSLTYWLMEGNRNNKERSKLFEQKASQLLNDMELENISIVRYTSNSIEDEYERNAFSIIQYSFPTILFIGILTTISLFTWDWVRSKVLIGLLGMITVGLAIGCSFGILMYSRVTFVGINFAASFILLGIGLDDMFVLISAWNRTDIQSGVPNRLAQAYSEAAVSITITTITNMLSFFLGATIPFPAVYYFCIYAGFSVMVTYIYFITFFGGCLAVSGYMEEKQKHALTWKVIKAKSEAVEKKRCYLLWCAGGINKNDPGNPKDNQPHPVIIYLKNHFSRFLNSPSVKVFIIFLFLCYLAGAIFGCLQMRIGFDYRNSVLDDSYLIKYYDVDEGMFRKFSMVRIQVIINEKITYSNPETKKKLLDLHTTFENLPFIAPSIFSESCIRSYYKFLDRRPHLLEQVVDERSFIKILKEQFLTQKSTDFLDIVFNEDGTQIVASRFIIQSADVMNANDESELMTSVRIAGREAPFQTVVFHPFFLYYDQFTTIQSLTIQTIGSVSAAMMVISFVFMPSILCTLWVTYSVVSIMIGVMGYMSLWGVGLDCIALLDLIMCIGFSVDYTAHIAFAYLTSKQSSPEEKVKECISNLGLPVVQSGITTIAGVFGFILGPSYAFRTFFKVIFLVIIFGTLHSTLLLLPVILSIAGPGSCTKLPVQQVNSNLQEKAFQSSIYTLKCETVDNRLNESIDPREEPQSLSIDESTNSSDHSVVDYST